MTKKILDVTCGSRTIWFNKNHPAAIYCDVRDEECTGVWKSTNRDSERTCIVHPDVLCDFTDLPFSDNSFALVVFDPPHLRRVGENAWMRKKYGQLGENWREMLHDGFRECMRVLKPDGVLIFKWAETQIPAADVEPVRHGEWLRTDDDWSSLVTIQCSACGGEWCFEVDEDVQLLGYNYCPGCGCKMDLEDETNDD